MRPLPRNASFRCIAFILPFLLVTVTSSSQTLTTINYSTSGLPNTVSSGSTADVFASSPVIGGYTHTTLSSLLSTTFGNPSITLTTDPPGFDGANLWLGASFGATHSFSANKDYNEFVTDAISFNYTFSPGSVYFIHLNYKSNTPSITAGLGLSTGPAQMTGIFSQLGPAMVNQYTNYPVAGMVEGVNDNFLNTPSYAAFFPISATPAFTDLAIPGFTVGAATTGVNIEILPSPSIADGTYYLEVAAISIAAIPPINPNTAPVCTTQTYTVPNPNNWPVSWSVSPAIASVSSSGNSVTVTKISNGIATLTANFTGPDGKSYPSSMSIQIGTLAAPTQMFPATENVPPNSMAEFLSPGADHWTVTNGTITAGQGTSDVAVHVANVQSGTMTVTAATTNACGVGAGLTNRFPIVPGSPNPLAIHLLSGDSTSAKPAFTDEGANRLPGAAIYPNPASDNVRVLIPFADISHTLIKIHDVQGHLVRIITPNSTKPVIDISRLAKGAYFISIINGTEQIVHQLIKQ